MAIMYNGNMATIKNCLNCSKYFKGHWRGTIYCSRFCQMQHLRRTKKIKDMKRKGFFYSCINCGKESYASQNRKGKTKYCSRSCLAKVHLKQFYEFRFKPSGKLPHTYK